MLKNTDETYGIVAKIFHWLMAVLIITMIIAGIAMTELKPGPWKWYVYGLHKSTGLLLLGLVIVRFAWRLTNKIPELPNNLPQWMQNSSVFSHNMLYFFMVASPMTGIVMSLFSGHTITFYSLFTIPVIQQESSLFSHFAHEAHHFLGYAWVALLSVHVTAALFHHYIFKDDILKRMMPSP